MSLSITHHKTSKIKFARKKALPFHNTIGFNVFLDLLMRSTIIKLNVPWHEIVWALGRKWGYISDNRGWSFTRNCRGHPKFLVIRSTQAKRDFKTDSPTHWTKSHSSTGRFIHCCLAAPLSVPGRLGAGAGGLLGDSAAAGQLHPTRCRHDQLSAHQQQQPQPATLCTLLTGVWRTWASSFASMMSCKIFQQSCKVQVQRFYQRDKTKRWSGLKLSSADGDWGVILEQWLKYQGNNCQIFKQSCKVQWFNQRDKTKSWSFLKLSSADGDGDVDHELRLECCRCYC